MAWVETDSPVLERIVQSRDATIVVLEVRLERAAPDEFGARIDRLVVEGTAQRHPNDRHDPKVGLTLARARAYRTLANKLERRAAGYLRHLEHIAEHAQRTTRPDESQVVCAGPGCNIEFLKRTHNQRYHSSACKQRAEIERRRGTGRTVTVVRVPIAGQQTLDT